jgi:hypothetical protein
MSASLRRLVALLALALLAGLPVAAFADGVTWSDCKITGYNGQTITWELNGETSTASLAEQVTVNGKLVGRKKVRELIRVGSITDLKTDFDGKRDICYWIQKK